MSDPDSSPVGYRWTACAALIVIACAFHAPARAADVPPAPASPYAAWKHGPSTDPSYFPIGVWLQNPSRADKYKAAGINLYVGLWRGPTEDQLAALKAADMRVICGQNAVGLAHKDDPTIAGWILPDEPDNAQPVKDLKAGKESYGPPVKPEEVVRWYEKAEAADPTRPVMLNLGQGVANDQWYGRGSGAKRDDYLTYVKAGDVVSFDVYPVAGVDKPPGHESLWLVGQGVQRLRKWTDGRKPVWAFVECTHIGDPDHKATPAQVRAEVWLALVSGANGIVYFVHEFKPRSNEHALLDDPEMLKAVTRINDEVRSLATVLNGPPAEPAATATQTGAGLPIAVMTKRDQRDDLYVFAVSRSAEATAATITLPGSDPVRGVTVLGEGRTVPTKGRQFEDRFEPWGVHLYVVRETRLEP